MTPNNFNSFNSINERIRELSEKGKIILFKVG